MGTVSEIQLALHAQLNNTRSLHRLVCLPEFEEAFKTANEEQRTIVKKLINTGNREGVEKWLAIQHRDKVDFESLTMRELRVMAQQLGIKAYNFLPKASLLSEIKRARNQETGEATC